MPNFGGLVYGPDIEVAAIGEIPPFFKPPAGLRSVLDIAAGKEVGIALRLDGTLTQQKS